MRMATYTEEQLKQAFEWGYYAGGYRPQPLTQKMLAKGSLSNHDAKAAANVWSKMKWQDILMWLISSGEGM